MYPDLVGRDDDHDRRDPIGRGENVAINCGPDFWGSFGYKIMSSRTGFLLYPGFWKT